MIFVKIILGIVGIVVFFAIAIAALFLVIAIIEWVESMFSHKALYNFFSILLAIIVVVTFYFLGDMIYAELFM